MEPTKYYTFKTVIVGNSCVGKTSIVNRLVNDKFMNSHSATLNLELDMKEFVFPAGTVKLDIWDTVGQEKYQSLVSSYFKGASLVVIVFDACDRHSFIDLQKWIDLIRESMVQDAVVLIAANKTDLTDLRVVYETEVREFLHEEEYHNAEYFEVSARTGQGVEAMFRKGAEILLKQIADGVIDQDLYSKKAVVCDRELPSFFDKYLSESKRKRDKKSNCGC